MITVFPLKILEQWSVKNLFYLCGVCMLIQTGIILLSKEVLKKDIIISFSLRFDTDSISSLELSVCPLDIQTLFSPYAVNNTYYYKDKSALLFLVKVNLL